MLRYLFIELTYVPNERLHRTQQTVPVGMRATTSGKTRENIIVFNHNLLSIKRALIICYAFSTYRQPPVRFQPVNGCVCGVGRAYGQTVQSIFILLNSDSF